ncbi:sigma-54-dependent transcriptional regulator [Geomesophilobacter sediminis]|uniref:Sigma 54-interacting transcriptional regulator n=1 Tax=Geomesophilobacter sediminis TaxID=2798584 RepID=A0A8J7IP45_9BACT|nr:sigma-54 dependent transcriptional regulator [Geomesophilobacter sediminis]MBJ6725223.1 sigma 54-interacting transcriptional regulator [Geomesophilobacter sediminis]
MNTSKARILCVDDGPLNLDLLVATLAPRGYEVITAASGPKALEKLQTERIDICLLDVSMPGMDGFELCRRIKSDEVNGNLPIVMITSYDDIDNRIRGIEAGAEDFISKPFESAEVLARIKMLLEVKRLNDRRVQLEADLQRAHDDLEIKVAERTGDLTRANQQLTREIHERMKAEESLQGAYAEIKGLKDRLQAENVYLRREVGSQYNFGESIGQSDILAQVFLRVAQVAPMDATVLLLGETGTGKGVVARAIHGGSSRKDRPLITVNCTTLPATLVESELFGREKGAFTGADTRQIGRFELAEGGTIFLDEIGEMPMELQCKLLRVVQDGEFERLGSPRTIKADVRIIAATNRNLEEEIRAGRFREDLFYRLNVFPITLPPLRKRSADIPLLVNHFVAKFNKKMGKKIVTVSKGTLEVLLGYHWPGNVRELESVVERAVITSQGTELEVLDRFDSLTRPVPPAGEHDREHDGEGPVTALVELERNHILQVLKKTGWRIEGINGAAGALGLNPSTLRARMRKYGIVRV